MTHRDQNRPPAGQPCEGCGRTLEPRWAVCLWLQPATCDACHDGQMEKRQAKALDEYRVDAMRKAGIHSRQITEALRVTGSSIDGTLAEWCEAPRAWAWVYGDYGTGKTTQAIMAAAYYAKLHWLEYSGASSPRPVVFSTVDGLLERIKREDFDPAPYIAAPRLILDEVGAEERTAWGAKTLRHIINERYNAHRATLFVGNFALADVMAKCKASPNGGWGMWDGQMIHRIAERAVYVTEMTRGHRAAKIAGAKP